MRGLFKGAMLMVLALAPAACSSTTDRIAKIGSAPKLSPISNPRGSAGYRPVRMPMPTPTVVHYKPNSLWRTGERSFFKDQRARKVGDILTIQVRVTDSANINNETERTRSGSNALGAGGTIGALASKVLLPSGVSTDAIVDTKSSSGSKGTGSVTRKEELTTNIAAVVMQVLPNGNMVVEGRQEIRVNYEIREMVIAGVIRPEDIGAENTIDSSKIAEARISYGGRGQITDVQQPRYGQQLLDILLPF